MALAVLLLAGCGDAADQAEAEFDLAMNAGTYADVCAAAREAAGRALKAGDRDGFERWRPTRDVYCASAERDPGGMPSRETPPAPELSDAEIRAILEKAQNSTDPTLRRSARDAEAVLNDTAAASPDGGN